MQSCRNTHSHKSPLPPLIPLALLILQIHAKRRALRMFDQYVMDVADFTFVKKLCRGAFATVYLAKRKDSGQHCAIKVIVPLR